MSTSSEAGPDDLNLGGLTLVDPTGPIAVFCYGSARANGLARGASAYACVFPDDPYSNEAHAIDDEATATNQRAILRAALAAVAIVARMDPEAERVLEVFSNSRYLNDAMTDYIETWAHNGWRKSNGKRVENRDLLEQLRAATAVGDRTIKWRHFATNIEAHREHWARDAHAEAQDAAREVAPIPATP